MVFPINIVWDENILVPATLVVSLQGTFCSRWFVCCGDDVR